MSQLFLPSSFLKLHTGAGQAHASHTLLYQRVNILHAVEALSHSVSHAVTLENLTELVRHRAR